MKKIILNWLEFSSNPIAVFLGTVFGITCIWILAAEAAVDTFCERVRPWNSQEVELYKQTGRTPYSR